MKRIIVLILIIALHTVLFASAEENIHVSVDGQYLAFDVPPTIVNGRTLIPVRSIFESLGLTVGWNPDTRTVIGTKDYLNIELSIDNKVALKNDQFIKLETPATIIGGRTFVPVRFIAESTGAQVSWNNETRTVEISQNIDLDQGIQLSSKSVLSATEIGKKVDAIVHIYNHTYFGEDTQGSGFAISSDGKIVTNYHVIDRAKEITITFQDDTEYTGDIKILGYDKELDLAVIKIEKQHLSSLNIGNSDDIQLGNNIYTIGSPLGLKNTLSTGIISGVRENLIQISAPISPGSSGGALLNEYGEVIGVTSAVYKSGENLGFAIPIDLINSIDMTGNKTLFEVYETEHDGIVVDIPVIEKIDKIDEHTARLYLNNIDSAENFVVGFGIYGAEGKHTGIISPAGTVYWDIINGQYIEVVYLPSNVEIDFAVRGHNSGVFSELSESKSINLGSKNKMTFDDFDIYLFRIANEFNIYNIKQRIFFWGIMCSDYDEETIQLDYYLDRGNYEVYEEVIDEGEAKSIRSVFALVAQEVRDYYKKDVVGYINANYWLDEKPTGELFSSLQDGSVVHFDEEEEQYYLDCALLWLGVYVEGEPNSYQWEWAKITSEPLE